MNKKTEDEETKEDLTLGMEAAERVLQKANEAVNRDLLDEALEDLLNRVDDWKNHKVEQFGKLILHGVYGVITGKAEQEKDVCETAALIKTPLTVTSTKSIYSSLFCSAARRYPPIRARIKRTRQDRRVRESGTRTTDSSSRAGFL